ncbi:uncharacterized protein I206_104264 [Kwoniella pini CBS 10737]|uniref:Uncharacterized protein n=1 Tax=Kwoniella pini CBS 10737 TaxID=1296096 RepID=A0A1B9I2E7_9TREE|nr:uncharacterized protein I206_04160 [Kwoniella pini CBS 10737]OCF49638.1 hypothetical protein I206_04160 [Kwoniella pini CBS 10737]
MSTEENDVPSTTPLDLLINAIAGSADYILPTTDHSSDYQREGNRDTRPATFASVNQIDQPVATQGLIDSGKSYRRTEPLTSRQETTIQRLTEHVVQSFAKCSTLHEESPNDSTSLTTIDIWHPTTGQKSYGKERRIISPPPKLCISGPLLPSITSVKLATTSQSTSVPSLNSTSTSQTHRIATPSTDESFKSIQDVIFCKGRRPDKLTLKRKLMEQARIAGFGATLPKSRTNVEGKNRDTLLEEGLSFSGLWIGEDVQKQKEFNLELRIYTEDYQVTQPNDIHPKLLSPSIQPFNDVSVTSENINIPIPVPVQVDEQIAPFESIHDTPSFAEVLDNSSMDVLQPLAQAVQQANQDAITTLADHLPAIPASENTLAPVDDLKTHSIVKQTQKGKDNGINGELPIEHTEGSSGLDQRVDTSPAQAEPHLTFVSKPLRIVSKPSQKTAKARSMHSCFAINSSFALWTRINAQTVRTKYMNIDHDIGGEEEFSAKLTSRTGRWTPFRFEMVRRAMSSPVPRKSKTNTSQAHTLAAVAEVSLDNEDILTYGSIVKLVDLQSGIKSDLVKIVKIEGGQHRVGEDEGQPISELQRIGFIKHNEDGSDFLDEDGARWYLSAPGARVGGLEQTHLAEEGNNLGRGGRAKPTFASRKRQNNRDIPKGGPSETLDSGGETTAGSIVEPQDDIVGSQAVIPPKKKQKTKRNALAAAVLAEDGDGGAQTVLSWTKADRELQSIPSEQKDAEVRQVIVERVDDWMSWIIGGVACSSQSMIATTQSTAESMMKTIDPIPHILVSPVLDSRLNTLDLVLQQVYFPASDAAQPDEPLEVYLGPIGPLYCRLWRSTAPNNNPTPAVPFHPQAGDTTPSPQNGADGIEEPVISAYPAGKQHVIVQIYMPSAGEILRVIQDILSQVKSSNQASASQNPDQSEVKDLSSGSPTGAAVSNASHLQVKETSQPQTAEHAWFDGQGDNAAHPNETLRNDELSIAEALGMGIKPDFETLHELGSSSEPVLDDQDTSASAQPQMSETHDQTSIDPLLQNDQQPEFTLQAESHIHDPTPNHTGPSKSTMNVHQNTIRLYKTEKTNGSKDTDRLPALPFILVRQSDRMGFGIGRSVIAQRLSSNGIQTRLAQGENVYNGEGSWGLRVIDT